jgi:dihydrofolate synthase / folylpolyglutamate synthase
VSEEVMSVRDAIGLVYQSYNRAKPFVRKGFDRDIRHPEWTRKLLDDFGRPDARAYNVSVTGSKGKGSHSILLAAILQKLGFRVGLFTGPHLVDFMERFRVSGQIMPESDFVDYIKRVHRTTMTYDIPNHQYIGPVGMLAVVACLWFEDMKTDVNVFECGRGAKHDDVNQVIHQGAVISPVFLEHPHELGPTLIDVAVEKAGVITPTSRWAVSNRQSEEVLGVLDKQAEHIGVTLEVYPRDYGKNVSITNGGDTVYRPRDPQNVQRTDGHSAVHPFVEIQTEWGPKVWLPKTVEYVAENAIVALHTARRVCEDLGRKVSDIDVIDLRTIRLPGRMDVVCEQPLMVVDGTIHRESAVYVRQWAEEQRRLRNIRSFGAILGLPADKDGEGVLSELRGIVDWVVVTKAHNPHLVFDTSFEEIAKDMFEEVASAPFVEDAMDICAPWLSDDTCVLLLGTQSFVGDCLRYFQKDSTSIWQ